ncbi:MAG: hypothetical protein HUU48_12290 [Flavobacteriales bacterium]|nr:hypothetical protein [Flavobacteriales bacterium]
MKLKNIITAITCLIIGITSCKKESNITDYAEQATCTGTTPTYTADVATILNTNCATSKCHNASSAKAKINLSDYNNASAQFRNNKRNLASVHHEKGIKKMPEGRAKLSDEIINKLDCWVKNSCPQ